MHLLSKRALTALHKKLLARSVIEKRNLLFEQRDPWRNGAQAILNPPGDQG